MSMLDIAIVDTDSHVTEPPDLWTSRVASKWGDDIPQVVWNEKAGEPRWVIGGRAVAGVGLFTTAGWKEHLPSYPPSLEEADHAGYDPYERLKRLDEYGVEAQVLYPNLIAFFTASFMSLEPKLALECVRAYNDFLVDFSAADPDRLLPLMMLPFWDTDAAIAEMERCKAAGHRGVLFSALFERIGLPNLPDPRWAPILDAAQSLELSMNFHIGFSQTTAEQLDVLENVANQDRTTLAEASVLGFLANARTVSLLTLGGVCHRYPRLRFVSVESGFGWIPFVLEGLDWQFENSGVRLDHPEYMRPSEYFRRQVYATYWFEHPAAEVLTDFQDNVMFETDFPHPTSLSPGPNSSSLPPAQMAELSLRGVGDEVRRKVLHDNAATIYGLA